MFVGSSIFYFFGVGVGDFVWVWILSLLFIGCVSLGRCFFFIVFVWNWKGRFAGSVGYGAGFGDDGVLAFRY